MTQKTLFNLEEFTVMPKFNDIVNDMTATNWELNLDNIMELSNIYGVTCGFVVDAYECIHGIPM